MYLHVFRPGRSSGHARTVTNLHRRFQFDARPMLYTIANEFYQLQHILARCLGCRRGEIIIPLKQTSAAHGRAAKSGLFDQLRRGRAGRILEQLHRAVISCRFLGTAGDPLLLHSPRQFFAFVVIQFEHRLQDDEFVQAAFSVSKLYFGTRSCEDLSLSRDHGGFL